MQAVEEKKHSEALPVRYKTLASLLREGSHNAITTKEIIRQSDFNDKRDVMEVIEQLIMKHGYCIGSSRRGLNPGYYIISDHEELTETSRAYNAQITSMLKRHRQLQKNFINKDQLNLKV